MPEWKWKQRAPRDRFVALVLHLKGAQRPQRHRLPRQFRQWRTAWVVDGARDRIATPADVGWIWQGLPRASHQNETERNQEANGLISFVPRQIAGPLRCAPSAARGKEGRLDYGGRNVRPNG